MPGMLLTAALSTGLGLGFSTHVFAEQIHTYIVDLNSKTVTDLGTPGGISAMGKGIN